MAGSVLQRASAGTVRAALASLLGVLATTTVHHVYGAALFETPWRLHIVYVSIPVGLALLAAVRVGRAPDKPSWIGRWASRTFVALGGIFAVAAIGVYEGGYNHLLPNLQYVLGMQSTVREGLYAPPDDLVFQLSGIAQFVAALPAATYLVKLLRDRPDRAGDSSDDPAARANPA